MPHCSIHFHDNWGVDSSSAAIKFANRDQRQANYGSIVGILPKCLDSNPDSFRRWQPKSRFDGNRSTHRRKPGPVPAEVPRDRSRLLEACNVLAISQKPLPPSRRCSKICCTHTDTKPETSREIDLLLNEADPQKGAASQAA